MLNPREAASRRLAWLRCCLTSNTFNATLCLSLNTFRLLYIATGYGCSLALVVDVSKELFSQKSPDCARDFSH